MVDFNEICYQHEKEGGRQKPVRQMDDFKAMNIQMEDLGAKGLRFTWSNNRRGAERVWEHIDRVLINVA